MGPFDASGEIEIRFDEIAGIGRFTIPLMIDEVPDPVRIEASPAWIDDAPDWIRNTAVWMGNAE